MEVKVTERGWAGHFICSSQCLFRRNTLLEYKDKKWIVSTVGAMRNHSLNNKMDSIGHERWYETMAFEAVEEGGYLDADVNHEISCGDNEWGMWASSWEELEEKYPTPDNYANDMHDKIVEYLKGEIKND